MKKVLLVAYEGLNKGGIQSVIMSIVRNLSDKYVFDIVLFTEEERYYDKDFMEYGGKIFRIPHYSGENKLRKRADIYLRGKRIYKGILNCIIENGPYSVIHCNNNFESAICIKAAAKMNIPIRIVHTHVITHPVGFARRTLNKVYFSLIKKYSTVRIGCSDLACKTMFGNKLSSMVINNPYDEKRFCPEKYIEQEKGELVITQIGNFSPLKNEIFSIHVMELIKKRYPNAKLNFVGFDVGGYEQKMKEEIKRLGLEDWVKIYPSDADTPYLLSKSSVFILPSIYEGFGIVLVEAQAMGVHCFASDTVPESTNAGGCTYLSLSLGEEEWARQILEWYKYNKNKKHKYDCREFTEAKIMESYIKIYEGEL